MQDSLHESEQIPLSKLEDHALQKLTEERVGNIVSNSEAEKELQDELEKKRGVLYFRLRELHENPFS